MGNGGYIFVDIEWNQKAGTTTIQDREPIQIAIIETSDDLEFRKRFSENIALDDMHTLTEMTKKIAHTNKSILLNAKSAYEVFKEIGGKFTNYNKIVVWTKDTYDLFCLYCKKTGVAIPKHNVIILQDVITLITDEQGKLLRFENALKRSKIKYEKKYLHYSFHDTSYLYELFKRTYKSYAFKTKNEYGFVNHRSKIVHAPGCRHLQSNVQECEIDVKKLIFKEYRPCKHCANSDMWKKLDWKGDSEKISKHKNGEKLRNLPLTEESIYVICQQFGLKANVVNDLVFVESSVGFWRIKLKDNKVNKVYHGNLRVAADKRKRAERIADRFHEQHIREDNFYDVIRYIHNHDKNIYKKERKTRIEYLFDIIERDNAMKKKALVYTGKV